MPVNYRRSHRLGLHKDSPNRGCTLCTQEQAASELSKNHALGLHAKVPRQTCPDCKAKRAAQWKKQQVLES